MVQFKVRATKRTIKLVKNAHSATLRPLAGYYIKIST